MPAPSFFFSPWEKVPTADEGALDSAESHKLPYTEQHP